MKAKLEEKVIPQRTETVTTYICETCGTEHDKAYHLDKCPICNKDVCSNCRRICYIAKNILYFDISNKSFILTNDYHDDGEAVKVCESCYHKIKANEKDYVAKIQELVNGFNKSLEQLSNMYLKGEYK